MYQRNNFHNYAPELYDLVQCGFPIFDDRWSTYIPEHKRVLERKIVDAYMFNQICCPEPERFKHYLNTQLEQVMPYYNKLYQSELIEFNPMLNHYIMTEKRTVENLVKEANTANSNIGKQVRDFIASAESRRNEQGQSNEIGNKTLDGTNTKEYNKSGTEETTEHTNQTGNTHAVEKQTGTQDENGSTTGTVTDRGSEHVQNGGQDNTATETTKEAEGTDNKTETGTVKSETTGRDETTRNDSGTEGVTTTGDSTKDSTIKESVNTTGTKKYSDTPQKNLSDDSILSTYLTNYTGTTDNSTKDGTAKEVTNYNEQKDTTKQNEGTENKTSEGKKDDTIDKHYDTETTENVTENGTSTTQYGATKDTQTDNTRTTNMQEDKTTTKNLTTTTDTERDLQEDKEGNKEWSENGTETGTAHESQDHKVDIGTDANSTEFNSNQEKTDNVSTFTSSEKANTAQTTDTGDNMKTSGYFNVSASQLLMAFRDTFINIDKMIIEELAENFMGVY